MKPPKQRSHVILFQHRFVNLIEVGTKHHTIRPPRKRQIQPGDALRLRHWKCSPYRSPQIEFMTTTCTRVEPVAIYPDGAFFLFRPTTRERIMDGIRQLNRFARSDGFPDWFAMREWFHINHGMTANNPFRGILIEWTPATP